MHTFELKIDGGNVSLTERRPGGDTTVQRATISEFLDGALHDAIRGCMNSEVLPAAIESASKLTGRAA